MGQLPTKVEDDNLQQVLESYEQERIDLDVKFLNQALVAATLNDNHECIGKLIRMGATNIDECIQLGKEKRVVDTIAMLLLMKATLTGNERFLWGLVNQLFPSQSFQEMADCDLDFHLYCNAIGQMRYSSTVDALYVARWCGQHSVHRKLMILTSNRATGCVHWSKLNLMYVDVRVLEMCTWLTELDLSANKLSTLPSRVGILSMMTNANLSDNNLTTIPASLLQLSKLEKLNLSHNRINCLPDIPHWSANLSEVDLSDNHLSSLPMNITASALTALNLSNNQFNSVPLCVCTFTTLTRLDLSDNPNIKNLPCEMCVLANLEELSLNGLKRLKEPPKVFLSSPQKCISYLRSKFNATAYSASSQPIIQLMVVGNPGSGKHTLVSRLQNKKFSSHDCKLRVYINEWECRPNITKRVVHFRIWIFNTLEEYTFIHRCFSSQHSLYLLLFNLRRESEGLHELKFWLESISQKAPCSSVMIIGTHNMDVIEIPHHNSDLLLQQAKMIAAVYENKLETAGFFCIQPNDTVTMSRLLHNIHSFAVSYPFLQRAIMREIGSGGERVEELLNHGKGKLDVQFRNQALEFATRMDSDVSVGKIIALAQPTNIVKCIEFAKTKKKLHALAMFLLIEAVASGDQEAVNCLLLKPTQYINYSEDVLPLTYCSTLSVTISSYVPIEIARRFNQPHLMYEVLMKTNVYPKEGYICWIGLQLRELCPSLVDRINWVKYLRLSRNKFTTLPYVIGIFLKQVVTMDLQYNELTTIPRSLLRLPNLSELNLSHNKLQVIPNVQEWSLCLTVLDLSNNQLSSLPAEVVAPSIQSLDISKNKFHTVPLCICSFITLHSLNLSDNSNIVALPLQMGRLSYLTVLNLNGLKQLNDPPKNLQKECRDCIHYLNCKLRKARGYYRMKLMVIGNANRGKTTLVARLLGKEYGDESTVSGVDVSEWWYRPSMGRRVFHFSIWDFAGREAYYATHQCFLSQRSLYLLLFNLKHRDKGVEQLRPWLNNIALRAPRSCVIIIGTHLDEIHDEERGEIDALLHRVGTLAASYNNKLQIVEVLPVGLKNRIENIGLLKEAIYNHAANYKNRADYLMGQKIPASYHALEKLIETVQQEVRQGIREPIMHVEEFKEMVNQMNLADIQDDEELRIAVLFFTDVGSLLHFDDRGHNLHELYFVDPCWLCDIMSKVVTIKERNSCGILYSKDIPMLFKDKQFPWQYFEQYLALLDRFEIALPLNNQRILIPSMLSDERPKEFEDEIPDTQEHVYSRFIMFSSANTPHGFWSRLLSMIMHSIPKVSCALDKSTPTSEPSLSHITPSKNNAEAEMSFSMHPMTSTETNRAFGEINVNTETSLNMSTKSSSSFQTLADTPESATPFIAVPTISTSLPFVSTQQPFISAPELLPNFPKPLPNDISNSFDAKDIHLEYWRTGLYYKDPEIMFGIESLTGTKQFRRESKDGVHVIASANNYGKKIIGQLVDLVVSLVGEWYPGLQEGKHGSNGLEQKMPCFECIKQGRAKPYEFKMEQCLPVIVKNETTIECGYFRDDPVKNHTVPLVDIVPDLLLQDIDPHFHINVRELIYKEDDTSLLGKGGYGKVHRGNYRGRSVAIKKYLSGREEVFTEFRSEAKLLQQSHHPCIVCLIGVCIQPLIALVLEEAPLKSLEFPILKKKIPVHRLTIFRIAAEVAAALHFLHCQGIIYRDLKAANVLLWTLDPDSLCHCKLADFGIATHLAPVGTRGLQGTKGFIAPEVLHISKRKQRSLYDHRADIFSFAMFLYQIIARRHPYHNIPPPRIDVTVEQGDRPKLQDVDISRTGYHYLTQVMKACWEDNPNNRLDTDTIIKKVCQSTTQMVMCVQPISGKQSLCRAVAITPSMFSKAGHPNRLQNELWVCCDGDNGAELSMFDTHHMMKVNHVFVRNDQVQCMALCGNHVWVATRVGIECGIIHIVSIGSRELQHSVCMHEISITCITATDKAVYLGTLEGYCFSFSNDISAVHANVKPMHEYNISEYAVDGIACTHQCLWVAHTRFIYFLNLDDLALEGSIHREEEQEGFIGQMSFDPDRNIIWSAHLGGVILSAWDAYKKCHMYDIDTGRHLRRLTCTNTKKNADYSLTAMTPALDTVWVGMASGHIMVFHETDLLCWFHPYESCIKFLTCIPSAGPCEMEKAMVASGGEHLRPLVEDLDKD